jgi:hypothetical protein
MATTGQIEYHVFVAGTLFTAAALDPVGTITELRGGTWYAGKLLAPPELGMAFGADTGLQKATDVVLRIADGPDGGYRALAANYNLIGALVDVTAVMRVRNVDGSSSEVTEAQRLTITGVGLSPREVTLKCQDIEEKKLDTLYPPLTWAATDWPQLSVTDAGKPLCFPVGTALKFPCPQIVSDDINAQYFFGVCTGAPKLLTITAIGSFLRQVGISGAVLTDLVEPGQVVYISGSSAADGRYTVALIYTTTVFSVVEPLPASTGGSVRLMPHVRTVYRSGRVVDPSEYQVIHIAATAPFANFNFNTLTLSGWTVTLTGTGSASAATGQAVLSNAGAGNTAKISQAEAYSKDLWYGFALDVDLSSTSAARVQNLDLPRDLSAGGRRAMVGRATVTNGAGNVEFTPALATGTTKIDNVVPFGTDLVALLFTRPQIDFQGNATAIEADVRGVESRNAADEVARLLVAAGLAGESASFATAHTLADTNLMLADCDYGRAGQRTLRAILDDHLYLLRGGLARAASGQYTLWQDQASSAVASLDESLGDSLQVDSVDWASMPTSVSLRYRPGALDPGTLQNTIKRTVTGGLNGDATPRELPYVRDHDVADHVLSYVAARAAINGRCAATIYRQQFHLSDVLTLGSPLNWGATPRNWITRGVKRVPNANKLDLLGYDASVYTYVASVPLPTDAAGIGYQPDYSQTPPLAPSALTITAAAVALAPDGTSTAWAAVQCVAPLVNWSQIWFSAIHNVTGEVISAQGTLSGGVFSTTLSGLRASNVYQLKAYAVNSFNVSGALQSTFDATAIGGGGAVTTFTTPGYANVPPNVASITAAQGTGRIVQVAWPAVSLAADVLGDYILERSYNGGAYAEVWRGRATSYTDRAFTVYLVTAAYRVKAQDRWGNRSAAYATSSTLTLNANIYGGSGGSADINANTVDTVNRTGVSTVSVAVTFAGVQPSVFGTIAHSLGRIPVATCIGVGGAVFLTSITNITTTNINVMAAFIAGATDSATGPGAHTHTIAAAMAGTNVTISVDIW